MNHGREAGASLAHPHGQLIGVPFVPGDLAEERSGFVRFEGSCLLCTIVDAESAAGHRVLRRRRPRARRLPVLERHAVRDARGAEAARAAVAACRARVTWPPSVARMRVVLDRLRHVIGDVAYNLVFHTAPHHQLDDQFHWHVHVVPRLTTTAGFEQGTGVLINIVAPETAAQHVNSVGLNGPVARRGPHTDSQSTSTRRLRGLAGDRAHGVARRLDGGRGRHSVHVSAAVAASAPRSTATPRSDLSGSRTGWRSPRGGRAARWASATPAWSRAPDGHVRGAAATRFGWDERLRFPWFLGGPVGAVLAVPILTRIWRRNLANLRARVEQR